MKLLHVVDTSATRPKSTSKSSTTQNTTNAESCFSLQDAFNSLVLHTLDLAAGDAECDMTLGLQLDRYIGPTTMIFCSC